LGVAEPKKLAGFFLLFTLLGALFSLLAFQTQVLASVYDPNKNLGNEVIYQVMLDRFSDGNSENNFLAGDPVGLFDPDHKRPMARWGGDIQGLIDHLDYLADLGVTIIYISPIIKNANELVPLPFEGKGDLKIPDNIWEKYKNHQALTDEEKEKLLLGSNSNYHGYWGEDWNETDGHLAKRGQKGFDAVKELVDKADSKGMKIIVDIPLNHSNSWEISGGRLYKHGVFITDRKAEALKKPGEKWYHDEGDMPLDTDPNEIPYVREILYKLGLANPQEHWIYNKRLAGLADFDIEGNQEVMNYMVEAHLALLDLGVAGFRFDAVPYIPPEALSRFEFLIRNKYRDAPFIGEWFAGGPTKPRSMQFYSQTGYSMFNFDLRWVFEKGFSKDDERRWRNFNWLLDTISSKFAEMRDKGLDPNDMVTFIDNHDLPRLRDRMSAVGMDWLAGRKAIEATLAMQFTMPGVPCLLYGIEQDLFDGMKRIGMGDQVGGDPYNRPMMVFGKDDALKEKVKEFINIRKGYPVFRYGKFENLDGQLKREMVKANTISEKLGIISNCGRDRNYGFVREDEHNIAFYMTNVADSSCKVTMPLNFEGQMTDISFPEPRRASYSELAQKIDAGGKEVSFVMDPFDYLIMVFKKTDPAFVFSKN
jgi:glycosidase